MSSSQIDPSLLGLVAHIDQRFAEADSRRSQQLGAVHEKVSDIDRRIVDTHARLEAHQRECDHRWASHDADEKHDKTNTSHWLRTGLTTLLALGASAIGWLWAHVAGSQR